MVYKISIGVLIVVAVIGASVWSYSRGLSASSAIEATKLMVAVQRQHDCLEESDLACAGKANYIMAVMVSGQLLRSDLSALGEADRMAVKAFIQQVEASR